jgi:hypothetical protein
MILHTGRCAVGVELDARTAVEARRPLASASRMADAIAVSFGFLAVAA